MTVVLVAGGSCFAAARIELFCSSKVFRSRCAPACSLSKIFGSTFSGFLLEVVVAILLAIPSILSSFSVFTLWAACTPGFTNPNGPHAHLGSPIPMGRMHTWVHQSQWAACTPGFTNPNGPHAHLGSPIPMGRMHTWVHQSQWAACTPGFTNPNGPHAHLGSPIPMGRMHTWVHQSQWAACTPIPKIYFHQPPVQIHLS